MLVDSFSKNERMRSILRSTHRLHLSYFFNYVYVLASQVGKIFICSKQSTAMIYFSKSQKRHDFYSLIAFIKMLLFSISWSHINQTLQTNKTISNIRNRAAQSNNDSDYIYVWFLAGFRKSKGISGLREVMTHLKKLNLKKRLPIYIETTVPRMVAIYQRAGFKFYQKKKIGNQIVWFAKYNNYAH